MKEKQVNQIVRALRSFPKAQRNLKTLESLARKNGRTFNQETISAILAGLRDAERASLPHYIIYK